MGNKSASLKSFKDQLSNIAHVAPLIGAYFIIYGTLKLKGYYGYFGLSIIEFIDFSELVLYFITDLDIIIILLVHAILNLWSSTNTVGIAISKIKTIKSNEAKIQELNISESDNLEDQNNLIRDNAKQSNHLMVLGYLALGLLFIYGGVILFTMVQAIKKGNFEMAGVILLFFVVYFSITRKLKEKMSSTMMVLISILIVMPPMIYFKEKDRAIEVTNGKGKKAEVFMGNLALTNDSTRFYLGKTKEAVLIYDKSQKKVDIYRTSDVTKISFFHIFD
ncbi:hypothetical protein SanaruYs_19740 [Chryseotalea sanaruensis]|uniref:Uncharacterized protein n=1 Tax=Chryseotalea sanaruensis TaxID=2482724 RepID=A0A401UA32_9BACT|nr:hypothetical protein [Chryseotalea sanaruensis]GCC51745.1 hypothetical protein SanaruYs_19740 [Chryseotalea sanaruensis]